MPNAACKNAVEDRTMTPKSRSLSGAALALVLIPMFAGLLACMPVPIGDPERSRIDPELSGVWAVLSDEAGFGDAGFYVFEPYDKRTWLVSGAELKEGEDADLSEYDLTTYDGFVELAASEPVADNYIHVEVIQVYKAWLKKLGGEVFMTWEPKFILEDGIAESEVWFVYKVTKDGPDKIRLQFVDGESDLFDDVKETRRAYEKVIRRNVDNPELYDDDFLNLVRVQDAEMDFFGELLEFVVDWT
jgi:hypothetical protein